MPENNNAQAPAESYNPTTGNQEVDPGEFVFGEEAGQADEVTTDGDVETDTESPEEGDESSDGESTETKPKDGQDDPTKVKTPVAEDKVLAGKFKSEEDLAKAFRSLGGDPSKFKTTEALVEAYEVRQAEFTRARQEMNAVKDKMFTEKKAEIDPEATDEFYDKMLEDVDWSKVKDVKDVMRQTLKKAISYVKGMSKGDRESLFGEFQNWSQGRESKLRELSDVEKDVPRLTTDSKFRGAFAAFVAGQKATSQFVDLKTSMADFLDARGEVTTKPDTKAEDIKRSGQQPEGGAPDVSTTQPKPDEVDDILTAHKSRKNTDLGI